MGKPLMPAFRLVERNIRISSYVGKESISGNGVGIRVNLKKFSIFGASYKDSSIVSYDTPISPIDKSE